MTHEVPLSTVVRRLGAARVASPLAGPFVDDAERVIVDASVAALAMARREGREPSSFEVAGPRELLAFEPKRLAVGILTSGGLCPGLNDVIRALVFALWHGYGVRDIRGLRHGFDGLTASGLEPLALTPELVADIHGQGGTFLGTCRGHHDPLLLATRVAELELSALFCIGGDGTLRGVGALDHALENAGTECAVVGIPKTIDDDILWCERTFGFETAVTEACRSIKAAHAEARGHVNGVGLVKLMGRDSGFIAATAALACPEVNFVLIPESDFDLEGPAGLLAALETRLSERRHAVVVVAEGAGQRHLASIERDHDASGNVKHADVGRFLETRITEHFHGAGKPLVLKYIDPSYEIRSAPAVPFDKVLCGHLARHAVHAALAGRTGLMIAPWGSTFVHVPVESATESRKHVDPAGALWQAVLASTGQPSLK